MGAMSMGLKIVELTSLNIDRVYPESERHFRVPDLPIYMTEDDRGLWRS